MLSDRWPLFELRIRTPHLELRYPSDDDLGVLVELAAVTGSWLVQRHQGRGVGKEMRAAVLHLAFAGLGAVEAHTSAFEDNPASLGVTRGLGYRLNGSQIDDREGTATRHLRFVLTSSDWEAQRRSDIEIDNLDACRDFLGLDEPAI